jgi:hypothetical protein
MTNHPRKNQILHHLTLISLFTAFSVPSNASAQQAEGTKPPAVQQEPSSTAPTPQGQQPDDKKKAEDKSGQEQSGTKEQTKENDRMLYVMPNFLTVRDESQVKPLTWKEKFKITAKGTFDPYEFVIVGVLSGIRQAQNSYPAFGQGMEGYAKRYGAAFLDQVDGNMMVGAVYPSFLHTDPRYFQMGRGGFGHRFFYAFSRVFVTRKDSGGNIVNIPELAGNATAIGISTLYYPAQDRSGTSFISGWGVQMGVDTFGNELKEFWPDLHRLINKRKQPKTSQ